MSANKNGIGPYLAAAGGHQSERMRRALRPLVTFLALCSLIVVLLMLIFSVSPATVVRGSDPPPTSPTPQPVEPSPENLTLRTAGANCSSPVEFDNQWGNGYRLVCQNNLYVLMVDLTNPAVRVEVVAVGGGTQAVSSFADGNTIAIINADYQWGGCSGQICSQGLTISNGSNPTQYTNVSHLCSDAWVRREIGLSQDGRPLVNWWYKFVSDGQARNWCGNIPNGDSGGGSEQYSYNLVGGGPQFTFDGSFHWDCQYGLDPTTGNCKSSGGDVGINGEHFGVGNWWKRYQSAIGYSSDGTVLVLAESNNQEHTMQEVHDIMYQRLNAYGKTLKNAFKFDGGSKAGFWYYNHTYDSTPGVTVPNVIRVQRTNSTCYSLSTNVNPGGAGSVNINTPSNCAQGKYLPGTNVQLTANANSGYTFQSWSGCDSASGNTCNVTMNGNRSVTANFSANPVCYTLTTNVNPGGSGSVSVNPGPNCGSQYTAGTNVTLTANPNSGYTFSYWSGDASGSSNPTTITMNGNKNVTANFMANPVCYTLITNVNPGGTGSVSASPGPNCGSQYTAGTNVTLTANPNSGYTFSYWSGDASGASNPTTITMNGNKNVTANFTAAPTITVDSVSVDHCAGGAARTFAAEGPSTIAGQEKAQALVAQAVPVFRRGEKICMGIAGTNHTNNSISTYWSWTTRNSKGEKIQALSYDDWPWTMSPGWNGAGWGPTIPSNLPPGLYTFTGSIRWDAGADSKSTTFTVVVAGGFDFDGDGKADAGIYRDGWWFIKRSSDGGMAAFPHGGLTQDKPLVGDFDGDGKADAGLYRAGWWFIKRSSDGGMTAFPHGGLTQDKPLVGDFDGDGKADAGLYRDGYWFIKRSSDGGTTVIVHGGLAQDIPFVGDFDGDGKADAGLYRDGYWFIKRSSDGGMTVIVHGGLAQDIPFVGDFDGDGKADAGLYRAGWWFIKRSSDGGMTAFQHGGLSQDVLLNRTF